MYSLGTDASFPSGVYFFIGECMMCSSSPPILHHKSLPYKQLCIPEMLCVYINIY